MIARPAQVPFLSAEDSDSVVLLLGKGRSDHTGSLVQSVPTWLLGALGWGCVRDTKGDLESLLKVRDFLVFAFMLFFCLFRQSSQWQS